MKKIFTFCFFTFALLIGTQSITAQSTNQINEKAANSAKELRSQLKFDEVALEKIYHAYQEYESKIISLNESATPSSQYDKDKLSITTRLQNSIKAALPKEVYARYLIISEQDAIETEN